MNGHEPLIRKLENTTRCADDINDHESADYFRHLAEVYWERKD